MTSAISPTVSARASPSVDHLEPRRAIYGTLGTGASRLLAREQVAVRLLQPSPGADVTGRSTLPR